MTHKDLDKRKSGRSHRMSGVRRLTWAAAFGVLLFGIGYVINDSELLSLSINKSDSGATTLIGNARYTRMAMESDRAAHASDRTNPTAGTPVGANGYYQPPSEDNIPDTPDGDAVKRGRAIFMDTPAMVPDHTGNTLSCVNCHLDAGRRQDSAPMWAAYVNYPVYRGKTQSIS
ncbi:MAG TPA: cytochrome C, partial [Burkholderiaceae bacterium]|nr:cytochrome C [Burkholderiaceae bacterium]